MNSIRYKEGYKYQLAERFRVETEMALPDNIDTYFVALSMDGMLFIRQDYAWDGPSGPTIDSKDFMRGSLVHDALYQLMRAGLLPVEPYREQADRILKDLCLEDGMSSLRAWWVYNAVRMFGAKHAEPCPDVILTAP